MDSLFTNNNARNFLIVNFREMNSFLDKLKNVNILVIDEFLLLSFTITESILNKFANNEKYFLIYRMQLVNIFILIN